MILMKVDMMIYDRRDDKRDDELDDMRDMMRYDDERC